MAMLTKVILKDDQLVPVVVEGVMVWVYSALDVLLTQGLTDVNGEVSFMLDGSADPGTEYILRFRKDGWSMTSGPTQKIRVLDPVVLPDTNIFDVQAHEYVHPESTDPQFCVLSGYLIDIFGRAWADRTIEFHLCPYFPETAAGGSSFPGDPSIVGRRMIVSSASVKTDVDGYLEVSLPRGGQFEVHLYGQEDPGNVIFFITVPDAAGWKVEEVFFPYIIILDWTTNPVEIPVGITTEVTFDVTLSDQRVLGNLATKDLLTFASADETIAIAVTQSGRLSITARALGSTTISVSRAANTVAVRNPQPAEIIADDLVIEVI